MIDGHCHLDSKIGNCSESMRSLFEEASASGIGNVILLNLPELAFDNSAVIKNAKSYNGFYYVFPAVNPLANSAVDELAQLKAEGASGLKLHPRLHGYHIENNNCIELLRAAGKLQMPVMIDCFPDGKNISIGNTPAAFARIAERVQDVRIAIGHAGGHMILDALMTAKYYKNIFLDLSYTLLYYRNSSVMQDISYSIENLHAERVFWGSDYPDRSYRETFDLSLQEFNKMHVSDSVRNALMESNVKLFLGENN